MHKPQPKKNKDIVTGKIDSSKVSKGHTPHRSGAGTHKHKNDKRLGNRSQQEKRIIKEQE